MADPQIQILARGADKSVRILTWHATGERVAAVRDLLGEPDHEALISGCATAAAWEAARDGIVITGEHRHG